MLELLDYQEVESFRTENMGRRKMRRAMSTHTSYHFLQLPQTRLHYVKCGEGPPLIMVPATLSDIDSWLPLAQLLGKHFTTYFFELPGHGKSTPYTASFSSELVAETVEAFMDELGLASITLMGFSFGGILAMKTLQRLQDRVEKVILFAPATTRQALTIPRGRVLAIRILLTILRQRWMCRGLVTLIQSRLIGSVLIRGLRKVGNIEASVPQESRLREISAVTLEVLVCQMREVFELEVAPLEKPFQQPVYFGMSVHDPLLDYETTLQVVESQFAHVYVERFYFPYHQPPGKPTVAAMERDFGRFFSNL